MSLKKKLKKNKMWTIIKFDKKRFTDLKKNFNQKLGSNSVFYIPKIKIRKNSKKTQKNYEFDLLGDYAFCYNKN